MRMSDWSSDVCSSDLSEMRHRYVAEQTLVSASLLSFLYVHVAAGEYCMAFTRQQKIRDAAENAALPLHLRPRIRQATASLRYGGRPGTNSAPTAPAGDPHFHIWG